MVQTVKEFAIQYINKRIDLKDERYKDNIIYHNEKGDELFSYKKFAQVLKYTCVIRCYKEDYLVFNYKTGLSDILTVKDLRRLIKYILDTIDKRFWDGKVESKIITLINRDYDSVDEVPIYSEYIFFKNGIYNINTRRLEEYVEQLVVNKNIPNNFNLDAKCPIFLQFINECMCGDPELVMCTQEMMGYVLVDINKAHKFFLFYGVGSNGKSVLCDLISYMVGNDNISSVSLSELKKNFHPSRIVGKKANISSENEVDFDTEKIKAISAGDTITIDVKNKQPFEHRPTCKLIFASNTLPNTMDNSNGFYRRLQIIPFNRIIKEGEKDVYLLDKLKNEIEGIIMWSLEGLHRLIDNGYRFTESKAVNEMLKSYKESQDPVYMFFKENLIYEKGSKINKKDLISRYISWLQSNSISGNGTDSNHKFWKELRRVTLQEGIQIEETKSKNSRYIKHLGWVA